MKTTKAKLLSDHASKLDPIGGPHLLGVLARYEEPHRFWHTLSHVDDILRGMHALHPDPRMEMVLSATAVFHDAVYLPWRIDNEQRSAELFSRYFRDHRDELPHLDEKFAGDVYAAILSTKDHRPSNSLYERWFCDLDTAVLRGPLSDQLAWEDGIFREYQFCDWHDYRKGRLDFLGRHEGCADLRRVVASRAPRIALFPGSFNPFHIGHMSILRKAELMFDKVVVALGNNPAKVSVVGVPQVKQAVGHRQVVSYQGLLSEFVNGLGYPVTVVRGLRGSEDLGFETRQLRFLEDLGMDAQVVYIPCDRAAEHVSSSALRQLAAAKPGSQDPYLRWEEVGAL